MRQKPNFLYRKPTLPWPFHFCCLMPIDVSVVVIIMLKKNGHFHMPHHDPKI
jgi:hypothetical protein